MSNLTLEGNNLVLQTPYNAGLVAAIKSLPYTERKYDPVRRVWIVDPRHGKTLAELVMTYLGEMVFVPEIDVANAQITRVLEIRYLGATKERENSDERSTFGYCDGAWSVIFPERVLINWFTGLDQTPDTALTYYGMLGLSRSASQDEIRTAFRRLARQWHPDVCKETNAQEQFIKIKQAFDILSAPDLRARYNAGLALEASLKRESGTRSPVGTSYRSPYRCGYVLAEGQQGLYFMVNQILAWEDIYNSQGQMLVTSWPAGAITFTEAWV